MKTKKMTKVTFSKGSAVFLSMLFVVVVNFIQLTRTPFFRIEEGMRPSHFTQIQYLRQTRRPDVRNRPLLRELVKDGSKTEIVGDVQFLLDFAVVGYPKTATTTMLQWLSSQTEILMYDHEIYYLTEGEPADMVRALYALPDGDQYKRGYKAPRDIYVPRAIESFQKYFAKTKLIVGIRHPVLWFESFYNYRMRSNYSLPEPNEMIGPCSKAMAGVCTDDVRYMDHLSIFGKTKLVDPEELKLLSHESTHRQVQKLENPIFLYEISQMEETNPTYSMQFQEDLKSYLGLRMPLVPLKSSRKKRKNNPYKQLEINICDPQYKDVHNELMSIARNASIWIRDYFEPLPEVHVSCPEHFHELLLEWMIDPCIARNRSNF
jgi:hypothetical protein